MRPSRGLLAIFAAAILLGVLAALPNLLTPSQLSGWPHWLPHRQITLGLDLRGGSHLVLEVDRPALVRQQLQTLNDDARAALADAGIRSEIRVTGEAVQVDILDGQDAGSALRRLVAVGGPRLALSGSGGRFAIALSPEGLVTATDQAAAQSLEIVRRRIDEMGVSEPTVQRIGGARILVQLPGVQDPGRIRDLLGSTAKLNFHMVETGGARTGVAMLPDLTGPETYPVRTAVAVSGEHLRDAAMEFDPNTHEPGVSLRFDAEGTRRFGEITQANVGRPFAIVIDDKVLSVATIQEPILRGSARIAGQFDAQRASDLALILRAGALPAKLTVVEERTVGADLGGDAIRAGVFAGVVGFALVVAFMAILYGPWGMLANLALALNVVLTVGALSQLGVVLTLPGLAGIVLSIGLAVDANVLINERIREETRRGLAAGPALRAGFDRAYGTIFDSNMTALIATVLLYVFGSGPVRGFAVTMGLGIATSMFTAVSVVRVLMNGIVQARRLKTLEIRSLIRLPGAGKVPSIPFMKGRFAGLAVSAVLSLASIGLFVSPGLNYGVDFRGGLQMEVATARPADLSALRQSLEQLRLGEVSLQEFGGPTQILVRAEATAQDEPAQRRALKAMTGAIQAVEPGAKIVRTEIVGPKVSGELQQAGIMAVVSASLAMLLYIWIRFEWPFAIGAIVTLVLDITKTIGFFALTGVDFNLTAIAALLTLIGYSVNDKVVVYDRMRENMRRYKETPLREIIDRSINETLARSLYTSATAFLALAPMAIWGGPALKSFAWPMVFGIVIAASSSVFIAAPILLFLGDWRRRYRPTRVAVEET